MQTGGNDDDDDDEFVARVHTLTHMHTMLVLSFALYRSLSLSGKHPCSDMHSTHIETLTPSNTHYHRQHQTPPHAGPINVLLCEPQLFHIVWVVQ